MLTWKRGPREIVIDAVWRTTIAALVLVGLLALFSN